MIKHLYVFFRDSSEDEELQEFYKNYFAGDVEVGFKKGRYFKEEKSIDKKKKKKKKKRFSKKKKQKKNKGKQEQETEDADDDDEEEGGGGGDAENTNVSNYDSARNINQSNIARQISQHSSVDGLYYGYQYVKVIHCCYVYSINVDTLSRSVISHFGIGS